MPKTKSTSTTLFKSSQSPESNYSDDQLLLAARLYYSENVGQSQIAKMVGVSQTKVSRMLAVARDRGIVQIIVPEFEPRNRELEADLCKRFKLKRAIVVRCVAEQSLEVIRNTLGYFAGPTVSEWIADAKEVAIGGGRTLEALCDHLRIPTPGTGPTFIQAMGNVAATPGSYDASEIGRKLAQKLGGSYSTLNTPAFLPSEETCQQLLCLKEIREVFDRLANVAIAFVGIGSLGNSVFIEREIFSTNDLKELRESHATGEVLGRFVDTKGKECDTTLKHRVVSLPLDKLRRIDNVVAVVVGEDRCDALRSALRGKLISSLVIDELTANKLLQ